MNILIEIVGLANKGKDVIVFSNYDNFTISVKYIIVLTKSMNTSLEINSIIDVDEESRSFLNFPLCALIYYALVQHIKGKSDTLRKFVKIGQLN